MTASTTNNLAPRVSFRHLADRKGLLGALFLALAVVNIVTLVALPLFIAIAFSLTDVTVGDTSLNWVGIRNFERITNNETMPQFRQALLNSFLFTIVSQVFIIVGDNTLALVLSQDFRGKWLARLLIMMPWATPVSLGGLVGSGC